MGAMAIVSESPPDSSCSDSPQPQALMAASAWTGAGLVAMIRSERPVQRRSSAALASGWVGVVAMA